MTLELIQNATQELKKIRQAREMIERKALKTGRPVVETGINNQLNQHQKAISSYIRQGDESALRNIGYSGKGLNSAVYSKLGNEFCDCNLHVWRNRFCGRRTSFAARWTGSAGLFE